MNRCKGIAKCTYVGERWDVWEKCDCDFYVRGKCEECGSTKDFLTICTYWKYAEGVGPLCTNALAMMKPQDKE